MDSLIQAWKRTPASLTTRPVDCQNKNKDGFRQTSIPAGRLMQPVKIIIFMRLDSMKRQAILAGLILLTGKNSV
jgi:hypothetical protein